MFDLHSHLLPNIDDGSRSMEESVEIIKMAYLYGVREIFVTPHFLLGSYDTDNDGKTKLFEELKRKVKEQNIPVSLYLGNEVFVENNLLELLKENKIKTLNNSRYLLFEIPRLDSYNGLLELIFELKSHGIEPVLAHPERYKMLIDHLDYAKDLKEHGAYFQCNLGSFTGVYGNKVKKCAKLLLKHHCIDFLGSDIHHTNHCHYKHLKAVHHLLKKYLKKDEIENILYKNAIKVRNNEEIELQEVKPFKKSIFGNWK